MRILLLLILCLTVSYAQEQEKLITDNIEQNSQLEFVTTGFNTAISFYRPAILFSGETYNFKFVHGISLLTDHSGYNSDSKKNELAFYLEYDVMTRLNKSVLRSFNVGLEAGACYRYMTKKGFTGGDGFHFLLGILLEYEINNEWQIILRGSGVLPSHNYAAVSAAGLGIRYSF